MDSIVTDDHISQVLMDLERSYADIDLSAESLERALDVYTVLNKLTRDYQGDAQSFEAQARPLLELCYAGTDVSFESYSQESMVETVKTIAKAILEAMRRLIKTVVDTLSNLDVAATWMIQQTNMLERKRVTSVGKSPKEGTVKIGRQHRYLRVGRVYAEDSVKVFSELKSMSDVIAVINSDYADALVKAAHKLNSVGNQLHGSQLNHALTDIIEDIGFSKMATRLKMHGVDQARFGRANVMGTSPLLGGMTLFYLQGNLVEKGVSALRFHGFVFTTTSKDPYRLEESRDFKAMSPADIVGLPEVLKKILMQVSKGSSDGVRNNMKRLRNELDRFVSNKMNSTEVTDADMVLIRSAVTALTYWSRSVTVPMYGNAMSVCRTVLSYAQASAKTWQ